MHPNRTTRTHHFAIPAAAPLGVTAFGSLRFASLRHPQGGLLEGRSALPIYRNIFTLPDIAADITLLIELGKRVAAIYGLNSEHIEYIKRVLGPEAAAGIFAKIAQFAASYLAKDGIILLLKKIGTRTVIKQGVKWAPIFGQLLAAGIGYQSTFMLGEQLVDEAESLAKEILDEIQKKKDIP